MLTHERIEVTPALAAQWLERNAPHNRKIVAARVTHYAEQMARGLWAEVGDPIRFSEDGSLVDGQHRLMAVAQSGTTVPMLVVRGLVDEDIYYIDQGAPRRLYMHLQAAGFTDVQNLAAAVSYLDSYATERRFYVMGKPKRPVSDLMTTAFNNEGLAGMIGVARYIYTELRFPVGASAAILYAASMSGDGDAPEFGKQLAEGASLRADSALFHLRKVLIRRAQSSDRRAAEMVDYTASFVRAWNIHLAHKPLRVLYGIRNGIYPTLYDPHGLIAARWPIARSLP